MRFHMTKKISKTEARYQDYPKAAKWCERCSMFRRPDTCTLVEGDINRLGYCKHWEANK
jgi:hypothetical protein